MYPKTAEFYLPSVTDPTVPTLFYRWQTHEINDGTKHISLQYLSTCGGGWMCSQAKDPKHYVESRLIKIDNNGSEN